MPCSSAHGGKPFSFPLQTTTATTTLLAKPNKTQAKYVRGNGHPHGYVVSNWSKNGRAIGPLAASSWLRVVPEGIYKVTQYASRRYGRPEIRITGARVRVWVGGGLAVAACC